MIWWKPRIQPPVLTVSSGWSSTYSDNSTFKFKMMPLHIDQPGAYLSGIEISRDMSHSPKITWQNTWTCFPCQRNLNPHSSRAEIWSFTWNISSCHHLKVASPYCWPLIRSAQGPWRRVPQTLRWPKITPNWLTKTLWWRGRVNGWHKYRQNHWKSVWDLLFMISWDSNFAAPLLFRNVWSCSWFLIIFPIKLPYYSIAIPHLSDKPIS